LVSSFSITDKPYFFPSKGQTLLHNTYQQAGLMSHKKSPTQEGTFSSGTAAPHLPMPRPELTLQLPDWSMWTPPTPNAPAKGGETIEDMFKQLPPHGKQDCATHLQKHETIDEDIIRIATLEGLYKVYWMLSQKAQNANRGTDHKEMLTKKA